MEHKVSVRIIVGTCERTLNSVWRLSVWTETCRSSRLRIFFISSRRRESRESRNEGRICVMREIMFWIPYLYWWRECNFESFIHFRVWYEKSLFSQRSSPIAWIFLVSFWKWIVRAYGMWNSSVIKFPLREFNQEHSRGLGKSEEEMVTV